jgi:hypothetical protein
MTKKGTKYLKMQGYPPCIFIIWGPRFGQLLLKRCLFCTNLALKRRYFLQEIGHFWPFYRAILLGRRSLFLLFFGKYPKSTLFPHELDLHIPIKVHFELKSYWKRDKIPLKATVTPLHFYHIGEPPLGRFSGKSVRKGSIYPNSLPREDLTSYPPCSRPP